jgi:tetratricopeptide (TPR) repeat protein
MTDLGGEADARSLGQAAQTAAEERRADEAVALWERALVENPRDSQTLIALTNHLASRGDGRGAIARCSATLSAHPDLDQIWMHMGILHYNCFQELDAAIQSVETCVHLNSDFKPGHGALAELYCLNHDPDKMRKHARLALSNLNTEFELYLTMRCLSDYEFCISQAERMLLEAPDSVEVLRILGKCLRMLGRYEEARAVMARAAAIAPLHFDVHHQLGELMILTDDLTGGWRQLEKAAIDISLRSCDPHADALNERRWRGQSLHNKRIILAQYAGFGDSFMFARYGKSLQEAGAHVTFACKPELVRLMADQDGFDAVIDNTSSELWADYDYWAVDQFVAPYLGAAEGYIAGAGWPSIFPPASEAAYWRDRLASDPRNLRVGLCWASAAHHFYGLDRSIPPEILARLADIEGVDWFAVQKFSNHRGVCDAFKGRLIDHSAEWHDFADSAGMIAQLDLLIPFSPEWRWGLLGDTSPWYPTLKLFRQPRLHAWDEVMADVAGELRLMAAGRAAPFSGWKDRT